MVETILKDDLKDEMEKTHNPLVSIIIPVYNVAPYIREALDSAIHQTYPCLEIIIVDDGSTDGSGAVCDEYALRDPRLNVIHQENQGVSNARNVALDHVTGDYFAFLDPDDVIHRDYIRLMLSAIEKADMVVCQYEKHYVTMNSQGLLILALNEGYYDRIEALRKLAEGKINTGVANKLYRKKLWNSIRFPEGHFYEDAEVQFQIFDSIKCLYFLDNPLYYYRIREGSTTQTFSRKNISDLKRSREWRAAFVKAHIPEVFNETHLRNMQYLYMTVMLDAYTKGLVDAKDVMATYNNDLKGISPSVRVICQMIRSCPRLLKLAFPRYQALRKLASKVFKR